ncbi:prepilin-type N-terminal cleavage/methylation domain-containing protein [Corallococcus exiguus]|uniref:pilus assembly FimT family protein n=1 Tax=Corallococcus TaxID=83461 RepID=UPI000EDA27FB|nr:MULTISPECIES: prepilin-type N-terminal cleavage/methylation domain-containing protein [Corallococcus]NNB93095.1 prepilin-type N-terminal cleavage/methylation domain-containing protein [Corallococcus exiguus]NPC45607.1 prepilin-type N-terminal cleavage/methylation domain-containing protein [Corallococcus exiguus]RKH87138.1 prepilin-type N-terminal cleavage/methylation domain-containing protein [Corallococcus sp. AB032C]
MKPTRGMTLLEMMTAVAVVGVVTALAVAGMQGSIGGQRENTATRELWSSALRARQVAISTNQPVRFVVENNVDQPDGKQYTVARWEQLRCGSDLATADEWSMDQCPNTACLDKTCRNTPACCTATGPDIIIPVTMNATDMNNLCFLPGSGRPAFNKMNCLQGQLGDPAAVAAAAPTDNSILFRFTSNRAKSVLMVEPLTGLSSVMDCDSLAATTTDTTKKDLRLANACTKP